jgi:hypothetical protein
MSDAIYTPGQPVQARSPLDAAFGPMKGRTGGLYFATGSPVVLLPSGTITSTGALSALPALPYVPVGIVRAYCVASAGLVEQLYYATFSSTSACQLWLDPGATIKPSGLVAGAYTAGTGVAVLSSVVIPGGSLGPNGALRTTTLYSFSATAGTKTLGALYTAGMDLQGGYTASGTGASTAFKQRTMLNRGTPQAQVVFNSWAEFGSNLPANSLAYADSTQDCILQFTVTRNTPADFVILDMALVEVLPG